MPETAEQPAKPFRTWLPMILWTAGILLFLGLCWFIPAVVVPTWEVHEEASRIARNSPQRKRGGLGGSEHDLRGIRVYLVLPKFLAPEKPAAVWMLSECGQPAVPLLMKCLHREDPVMRGVAIMALGEIGPLASEATPALEVTATNDTEACVREAAREALKKVRGDTYIVELRQDRIVFRGINQPPVVGDRPDDKWAFIEKLGRCNVSKDARCRAEATKALAELKPLLRRASAAILIDSFRDNYTGEGEIDGYVSRDGNAMIKEELSLRGEAVRADLQRHVNDPRGIDTGPSGPDECIGYVCRELLEALDANADPAPPRR